MSPPTAPVRVANMRGRLLGRAVTWLAGIGLLVAGLALLEPLLSVMLALSGGSEPSTVGEIDPMLRYAVSAGSAIVAIVAGVVALSLGGRSLVHWRAALAVAVGCFFLLAALPIQIVSDESVSTLAFRSQSAAWSVLLALARIPACFALTCVILFLAARSPSYGDEHGEVAP